MALLLRDQARVQQARSFYRDVYNTNDYFYMFVSRATAWADETSPDTPVDNRTQMSDVRRQMLFAKRVQGSNVALLTKRINWVSGTVYDPYDDNYSSTNKSNSGASSLADANFYVLTDNFNVYKCIDNNSNAQSTVKPTTTGTDIVTLSDGYKWKFMLTVGAADRTLFLTDNFIPIRKVSGSGQPAFDVNGELDSLSITSGGSGYSSAPTVVISGDGTGAAATATVSGGAVNTLTITSVGSGYSFAYVEFTGGSPSTAATATASLGSTEAASAQQSVEATAISGSIDKIIVTAQGADYIAGDALVSISGDGTGATASPTINSAGNITGVTISAPGTNYTFADISITQTTGTGAGATFRAIISPENGHGSNAQKELFAKNIGMTVSFENTNEDLILGNEFRQVGVYKNPYQWASTSSLFTTGIGTPCHVIGVSNPTQYNLDDIVTTTEGGKFREIQKIDSNADGTIDKVYLQQIIGGISASSTIKNVTTAVDGLTINSATNPEIDPHSGDLLYVDNRRPVVRDSDQTETIKVVFKF